MSVVYFLHAPLPDLFKVGYTRSFDKRLADIRSLSPCALIPLACLHVETATQRRDGIALERRFHERYLPYHAHGEWFHRNPSILSDIESISAGTFDCGSLPNDLSEASLLRAIRRGPRKKNGATVEKLQQLNTALDAILQDRAA